MMLKKITLFGLLSIIPVLSHAQNTSTQLDLLIERYESIPANGHSISSYFDSSEMGLLKNQLSINNASSPQAIQGGGAVTIFGNHGDSNSFVSFSTDESTSLNTIGSNSGSSDFESSGDIDPTNLNRAYALTINTGEFYEVNITTGVYTFLGIINPPGDEVWNGIEFDPQTNILYAISSNFADSSTVSTIDIPTLEATTIGGTGMLGAIAIATDGAGNFYSYDIIDDNFYSIDITTGLATLIGPIGFNANFGQDLEWDPEFEVMYMTALNSASLDGELRTVDLTTGETTFISIINTSDNGQIPWASIVTPTTAPDQQRCFPIFALDDSTISSVVCL